MWETEQLSQNPEVWKKTRLATLKKEKSEQMQESL